VTLINSYLDNHYLRHKGTKEEKEGEGEGRERLFPVHRQREGLDFSGERERTKKRERTEREGKRKTKRKSAHDDRHPLGRALLVFFPRKIL